MSKIGRNAPCPCGSGRKYKKCCQGKGKKAGSADAAAAGAVARGPAQPVVPIQKIETSVPVAKRLQDWGIDASPKAFLRLASKTTSVMSIAATWQNDVGRKLSSQEEDFLQAAARELWEQYCPERPAIETLYSRIQEGYDHMDDRDLLTACRKWWAVWEVVADRLQPEMTSTDKASSVFDGAHLHDWLQDFSMEIANVIRDEPQWATKGAEFCRKVLEQFPAERKLFRLNFRLDEADFICCSGDDEAGERAFLRFIADHPDEPGGYARLAESLEARGRRNSSLADLEQARQLLRDALARPVEDPESYSVEDRLQHIEKQIEAFPAQPER